MIPSRAVAWQWVTEFVSNESLRRHSQAVEYAMRAYAKRFGEEMEKTLLAVDELTGFIIAVALVRPSKSLLDVELKSIKKKWKDKAFAAPVNRQEIEHA